MSPYITALLVYSLFLMLIGWWTSRSVRRAEDFFVAGRKLSPVLLFSTLLAANLGAGSTVGATGIGYTHGLSAWWWVGSAGIGSLVLGLTVGPRMWRVAKDYNLYTVGDYLEHRYSRTVRGVIAVLLWFGSLAILAGQLIPLAWILNLVLGIPKYIACLAGGAVVVTYFSFGGLTSTARVNMVQLVVKLSGFILAFVMIVLAGDLHFAEGTVEAGFTTWFGDDPSRIWGYFIVLAPAFIVSPGLLQKIYGARDARTVRRGVSVNAVALMLFAFIPALLGMAAYQVFPSLPTQDLALPRLLMEALPFWIGGLTLAAVFSAEISSADAVLFMLTTSLSRDLYQTYIDPDASEQRMLTVSRITAVVAGTRRRGPGGRAAGRHHGTDHFLQHTLRGPVRTPGRRTIFRQTECERGAGDHSGFRPGDDPCTSVHGRQRNRWHIPGDLGHWHGGAHHGAAHVKQA